MQIARQLGCARSPVYASLRDFRLHRNHILRTVAADRLLVRVTPVHLADRRPNPPLEIRCGELARMETDDG